MKLLCNICGLFISVVNQPVIRYIHTYIIIEPGYKYVMNNYDRMSVADRSSQAIQLTRQSNIVGTNNTMYNVESANTPKIFALR